MIVLGFDTATPSTAVGLRLADGAMLQARDDPGHREHPGHATRLLAMASELLDAAGLGWSTLDRIAVGLGPGTFTGLRVGVATARALAQSLSAELVGVSSLRALARGAGRAGVLAVIDARRGEVFAAAYGPNEQGWARELVSPRALAPEDLAGVVAQAEERGSTRGKRWLAVGDGAVRFRGDLEAAGVTVAGDSSPLHVVGAEAICALGVKLPAAASYEEILPDYRRRPDAEIALEGVGSLEGARQ
jgi:tRNA threonylcarbamoyladenosine biosynthesis protein TsaB